MRVAATGHRPGKLYPDAIFKGAMAEAEEKLYRLAAHALIRLEATEVISGMALGWDMAIARAAVDMGLPLTAAIPFRGQEERWADRHQRLYHHLLSLAATVHVQSPGRFTTAYLARDEWMVDHAEHVAALYNGVRGGGGTAYTVEYARGWLLPVTNFWRAWEARR